MSAVRGNKYTLKTKLIHHRIDPNFNLKRREKQFF